MQFIQYVIDIFKAVFKDTREGLRAGEVDGRDFSPSDTYEGSMGTRILRIKAEDINVQ